MQIILLACQDGKDGDLTVITFLKQRHVTLTCRLRSQFAGNNTRTRPIRGFHPTVSDRIFQEFQTD